MSAFRNSISRLGISHRSFQTQKRGFSAPISPATSLSRPEKTRSQSWKLLALHSFTSRFASSVDIGLACFHRTASLYFFPADLGDAPTECRFKVGWSANRRMNLCPTEPVQPKTPHFFLGTADPILLREKILLKWKVKTLNDLGAFIQALFGW